MNFRASLLFASLALSAIAFSDNLDFTTATNYIQSGPNSVSLSGYSADETLISLLQPTSGTITNSLGQSFGSDHSYMAGLYFHQDFASKADMEAAFPVGNLDFSLSGGAADGVTGTINRRNVAYPLGPVKFKADSYDRLQHIDGTKNNRVVLEGIQAPYNSLSFKILDTPFYFFPGINGNIDIPAGYLQPGKSYTYEITFGRQAAGNDCVLDGQNVYTTQSNVFVTRGSIMAVPEPGTWAVIGLGLAAFTRRRRK